MGSAVFDAAFQKSANGIIRIDKNGNDWLYYKRITDKASFRPFYYIYNNWFSFNNLKDVNFELYFNYADALAGTNKYTGWAVQVECS
jgi:hypothetical protein